MVLLLICHRYRLLIRRNCYSSVCPGTHLADASIYIAIVKAVSAFSVSKAIGPDGKEIIPVADTTEGVIVYVLFLYRVCMLIAKRCVFVGSVTAAAQSPSSAMSSPGTRRFPSWSPMCSPTMRLRSRRFLSHWSASFYHYTSLSLILILGLILSLSSLSFYFSLRLPTSIPLSKFLVLYVVLHITPYTPLLFSSFSPPSGAHMSRDVSRFTYGTFSSRSLSEIPAIHPVEALVTISIASLDQPSSGGYNVKTAIERIEHRSSMRFNIRPLPGVHRVLYTGRKNTRLEDSTGIRFAVNR